MGNLTWHKVTKNLYSAVAIQAVSAVTTSVICMMNGVSFSFLSDINDMDERVIATNILTIAATIWFSVLLWQWKKVTDPKDTPAIHKIWIASLFLIIGLMIALVPLVSIIGQMIVISGLLLYALSAYVLRKSTTFSKEARKGVTMLIFASILKMFGTPIALVMFPPSYIVFSGIITIGGWALEFWAWLIISTSPAPTTKQAVKSVAKPKVATPKPLAYKQSLLYFREILQTKFSEYSVYENQPLTNIIGEQVDTFQLYKTRPFQQYRSEWGIPVDFLVCKDNIPVLAIVIGEKWSQHARVKFRITKAFLQRVNIAYLPFYSELENEIHYVVDRIAKHLPAPTPKPHVEPVVEPVVEPIVESVVEPSYETIRTEQTISSTENSAHNQCLLRFKEILQREFPGYSVRENLPLTSVVGNQEADFQLYETRPFQSYKSEWGRAVDFLLYKNDTPVLAIVVGEKWSQHKFVKFRITEMYLRRANIAYLPFYSELENDTCYIVDRIAKHL